MAVASDRPCGHAGFVLKRALGVGGCDVLGHSSHWSFNETKPGSLEWSFQHLLMCL